MVTVTGDHPNTPTAAIVRAAGLDGHPPLISVDPGPVGGPGGDAAVHRHRPRSRGTGPTRVTIAVTERVPVATMAGPATSWSTLDGDGRTLAVTPGRPGPAGARRPRPPGARSRRPRSAGRWPPAADPGPGRGPDAARRLRRPGRVGHGGGRRDGRRSPSTRASTVLLGTDSDLPAKYEDVAAIIAHAPLRGAHTIDVTVPESPTVGP